MAKSKILFLAPYPLGQAPSQRFRFEQYLALLQSNDIEYAFKSFLDNKTWTILYKSGFIVQKAIGIVKGFVKRWVVLFSVYKYDKVFIHREVAPVGPPIFEWIITKILKKHVIFDFDDAIWLKNTSEENRLIASLKWHSKTKNICKWSSVVSVGNKYLAAYAQTYNSKVITNPTTIDTAYHIGESQKENDVPVIGWTGSHSTGKYLGEILSVLEEISGTYVFEFRYISNAAPEFSIPNVKFVKWTKETEIEDLKKLDIGIMPLKDDDWAKGKCGFKALQYMALKKVALISPVGINNEIIVDGVNGFICANSTQWKSRLIEVLKDVNLRKKIGEAARKTVEHKYSVNSNFENFLNILKA